MKWKKPTISLEIENTHERLVNKPAKKEKKGRICKNASLRQD